MRAPAVHSPAAELARRSARPEPQAKAAAAGIVDRRPQTVAQRQLAEFVQHSPRVAAQAKRKADLFTLPVRRAGAASPGSEHLIPHGLEADRTIQGKANPGVAKPTFRGSPQDRPGIPVPLKEGIESSGSPRFGRPKAYAFDVVQRVKGKKNSQGAAAAAASSTPELFQKLKALAEALNMKAVVKESGCFLWMRDSAADEVHLDSDHLHLFYKGGALSGLATFVEPGVSKKIHEEIDFASPSQKIPENLREAIGMLNDVVKGDYDNMMPEAAE